MTSVEVPVTTTQEVNIDMLKGIAVVIDDGIGKGGQDNINEIISKVRAKGIPTAEFKDIESAERCASNLLAVNFIILDWKMETASAELPTGVQAGQELTTDSKQKVVEFIKKLKTICFAPIFIFTNEAQSDIEADILAKLRTAGLYFDQEGRDFIYVRNKNDIIQNDKLFIEINQWIHKTPSIYVLKTWDKEFFKAKNEIFWDLYNKSNGSWPKVLWEHCEEEKEVPYACINEVIFQLVSNNVTLQDLDKDKVKLGKDPDIKEMKDIFRRIMFQEGELAKSVLGGVRPGDIFKENDIYYLNIRPECDTVEREAGKSYDIYLIKGTKIADTDVKKLQEKQYSPVAGLHVKVNEAFVWLIEGDGIVKFDFKEIEAKKFADFKDKRLCRLLPPYITNIQQRFSSYFGRFGIPRLPKALEKDILRIAVTPATQ